MKIGIVDDHAMVRAGFREVLDEHEVVWEAEDGRAALSAYAAQPVDVVLMDLVMPGKDGLDATKELRAIDKNVRVVVVSYQRDSRLAARAIQAGALGYVCKREDASTLRAAIRAVAEGGTYIPDDLREIPDGEDPFMTLSDRELQVLMALASGRTNREIAEHLCVSPKTVDSHRLRLLQKLQLRNNSDLTRYAIRSGLLRA